MCVINIYNLNYTSGPQYSSAAGQNRALYTALIINKLTNYVIKNSRDYIIPLMIENDYLKTYAMNIHTYKLSSLRMNCAHYVICMSFKEQ